MNNIGRIELLENLLMVLAFELILLLTFMLTMFVTVVWVVLRPPKSSMMLFPGLDDNAIKDLLGGKKAPNEGEGGTYL